jgi:hypothetical protein
MTGAGPQRTRAAVACSVADQGVTALTNIAVLVVAARHADAEGFAVFAVVYTVFTVVLGLYGAYAGHALVLERGESGRVRTACRSALAFTAASSAALGAAAAAVLLAAPWSGGLVRGFLALACVLPVVLTQECLRYAFSTLHRADLALAADALRLAVTVPALALQPDGAGPERLLAVWGLSALPALGLGVLLLAPLVRGGRTQPLRLVRRGHLGRRFALEFAVGNAGTQLAVVGLGLWASPLAVGALRGATTLFGPVNVLFNATTGFGPPLLARAPGARRRARAVGDGAGAPAGPSRPDAARRDLGRRGAPAARDGRAVRGDGLRHVRPARPAGARAPHDAAAPGGLLGAVGVRAADGLRAGRRPGCGVGPVRGLGVQGGGGVGVRLAHLPPPPGRCGQRSEVPGTRLTVPRGGPDTRRARAPAPAGAVSAATSAPAGGTS